MSNPTPVTPLDVVTGCAALSRPAQEGVKTKFEQHPLSAAFPAMPEVDLEALAEDIKAHGQREPGLLHEGMVLDGWHRYLACEKAGVS